MTVGGVDIGGKRVPFSGTGSGRLSPKKPDVCLYTGFRGYDSDSGVSASCALAASCVARVRSVLPFDPLDARTHPSSIRALFRETAKHPNGPKSFSWDYGWGIVDMASLAERLHALRCGPI